MWRVAVILRGTLPLAASLLPGEPELDEKAAGAEVPPALGGLSRTFADMGWWETVTTG